MAQADDALANVEDGQDEQYGNGASDEHATCHGSGSPRMPHSELTQEELDRQFPTLVPPADEMLDDLSNDVHDSVYQTGLKVAEEIRSETSLQGRLRRPLLAGLQEQQQKDLSRSTDRARTSRTLGGGVLTGATALAATATAPTTTTATTTATTATATTAGTTGTGHAMTAAVTATTAATAAATNGIVRGCKEKDGMQMYVRQIQSRVFLRDFDSS